MRINRFCSGGIVAAVVSTLRASVAFAQVPAPVARWTFEESAGTTAANRSAATFALTLQNGAAWSPSGAEGKSALRLNGMAGGDAEASAPVVDTSRSYTISAWVRLNKNQGFQTVASIDGAQVSAFYLQVRDNHRFAFTLMPEDAVPGPDSRGRQRRNANQVVTSYDAAKVGVWYHIAGVYDANVKTAALYVNGILQEILPFTSTWKATGVTAIGRGKFGGNPVDWLDGDIDDVQVFAAPLTPAEVSSLVSQRALGNTIHVDLANLGHAVAPQLYGLMTEEINYSYDGGLYAELIRNRAFKDDASKPVHWAISNSSGGAGTIDLDPATPLNASLATSLKLTVTQAGPNALVGAANDGFWGFPVQPRTRYAASLSAKAAPGASGPLTLRLQSADGKTVFAEGTIPRLTSDWQPYQVTLETGSGIKPTADARFVVGMTQPGTVWLQRVSLFPPTYLDQPGGFRMDLMKLQEAMKPAFLRMPGGNYLEGNTIPTRFDWKKTIGPLAERSGHDGPWGYRSSDGMGLMEFLMWCEDLKMEPLLAVYAGYSLRQQHVDPGEALVPYVQDALDEIEYLTGPVTSKWGAVRAQNGHPAPFPLHYIEIGNEDWFDRSGSYDGRFAQFYDAIRAKYPQLQLIATAGVKSRVPDILDEHYYRSARDMSGAAHQYDTYNRNSPTKIFVGEWASQEGEPTPNLHSALGDAAWMTGMERNSDIVILESYAPMFTNVNPGGHQWHTNLIGYDALSAFGSPAYWAQQMFATHVGDTTLPTLVPDMTGLYESATIDRKTNTIYLKMVNMSPLAQTVTIALDGNRPVAGDGTALTLTSDNVKDTNTITEPDKIVPREKKLSHLGNKFVYEFPANSITILTLHIEPERR